jgi:hypothetical protein
MPQSTPISSRTSSLLNTLTALQATVSRQSAPLRRATRVPLPAAQGPSAQRPNRTHAVSLHVSHPATGTAREPARTRHGTRRARARDRPITHASSLTLEATRRRVLSHSNAATRAQGYIHNLRLAHGVPRDPSCARQAGRPQHGSTRVALPSPRVALSAPCASRCPAATRPRAASDRTSCVAQGLPSLLEYGGTRAPCARHSQGPQLPTSAGSLAFTWVGLSSLHLGGATCPVPGLSARTHPISPC